MKVLSEKEVEEGYKTICGVMQKFAAEWTYYSPAPFMFEVNVPVMTGEITHDKETALKAFNELFHVFGVLPKGKSIAMGEARDYCMACVDADGENYCARFNHSAAMQFKDGDEEYQGKLTEKEN